MATLTGWAATLGLIAGLVVFDLWQGRRRPHAVGVGEAAGWSVFYVAIAVLFGVAFALIAVILTATTVASVIKTRRNPRARAHAGSLRGGPNEQPTVASRYDPVISPEKPPRHTYGDRARGVHAGRKQRRRDQLRGGG